MAFLAIAPCVTAKDQAGRIHYHYESINPVIPWLSDEQAEHFIGQGLVVEIDDDAVVAEDPADLGLEPKHAAPKAAWVKFAISKGADPAEAEATNKPDLIALYGTPSE